MAEIDLAGWNEFLSHYPDAHLLQTGVWGELKTGFGWFPARVISGSSGAQLLFRRLPLGWTIAYLPKGPVGEPDSALWEAIDSICRSHRAIFLKVEVDTWEEMPISHIPFIQKPDLVASRYSIQPRRTILVDLDGSEEDILARMKQKCRYNIRLAQKKGVTVRSWNDVEAFHRMMVITGARDAFGIHSLEYYQRAHDLLHGSGLGELLVAEYAGKPLAALMVCSRGQNAWYLYGASTDEERSRMPAYLLQWEAMRWAKAHGARMYDLWGVPDEDETVLEANFENRHDGLWGVYRFKRGFGGKVARAAGAVDKVYQPWLYRIFLAWMRRG